MQEFRRSLLSQALTVILIFICLFAFTRLFGPIPLSMNSVTTSKQDLFTVRGTGEGSGVPNTASFSFGVTKTANSVQTAQDQVNTVINSISEDLQSLGVDKKDIKTTDYSVTPNYDYSGDTQKTNGYIVTANIQVNVKPIANANKAVDIATKNGANLVGGITFGLDDATKKEVEEKARMEAINNAKEKAASISHISGIHLGRIVNIQEDSTSPATIYPMAAGEALRSDEKSTPTQLNPGENKVQLTVTISYETY